MLDRTKLAGDFPGHPQAFLHIAVRVRMLGPQLHHPLAGDEDFALPRRAVEQQRIAMSDDDAAFRELHPAGTTPARIVVS